MIHEAIERVQQMEALFDKLQIVLEANQNIFSDDFSIKTALHILLQYYESGQWLQDYELDEKGLFPQDLKRGVLSQDALYDMFDRIDAFYK